MVRRRAGPFVRKGVVLLACLLAACATRLAAPEAPQGDAILGALEGLRGDAGRGLALLRDRTEANCVVCHAIPDPALPLAGDVGPSLANVSRRLSPGQIRLRIVDIRRIAPRSVMPSYHRVSGLTDVAPAYRGRPVLTAQQVEDLVAYLATLQ